MSDEPLPEGGDAERALLGQEPTLTAAEAAAKAGLPLRQARRLWRTLGFPERGDERAYNEDDVAAISAVANVVNEGLIDFDLALNVVRGVGLSMARLADWEVGALIQRDRGGVRAGRRSRRRRRPRRPSGPSTSTATASR